MQACISFIFRLSSWCRPPCVLCALLQFLAVRIPSLMTSHDVMYTFCGRFPLQKQFQKYNGNTHIHPIILSHPSLNLWPRSGHTFSATSFSKGPQHFSVFKPAVHLDSKSWFSFNYLKTSLTYFQFCHWSCFSYKIFVLAPIRSVQVALDSQGHNLQVHNSVYHVTWSRISRFKS